MADDSASKTPLVATLADAAESLESALKRFEELTAGACKIQLNSEKNLARAARAINEAAASQEKIAQTLSALVKHINGAQVRQQSASERVYARAQEIKSRTQEFESFMQELIAVGAEAGAITSELQRLTEVASSDQNNGKSARQAEFASIELRMVQAVARAKDVEQRAQAGELSDVVRHADSLRQQIEAARSKLASWMQS